MPDSRADILFVNLPSPPRRDILREFAGGFGVALPSQRDAVGHGPVKQPYLALVYGATIAGHEGHEVGFLDAQAEGLGLDEFDARVRQAGPAVIVAPLGLPSLRFDLDMLGRAKRATGARVVTLGTVCRVNELLPEILGGGVVDVAISGDLEVVAKPLFEQMARGDELAGVPGCTLPGNGSVERTPGGEIVDLDALPVPDLTMLPMDAYRTWEFGRSHSLLGHQYGPLSRYFPLYTSRGCPHCCEYCPYPLGWGKRWRRKSVDHVLAEFAAVGATGTFNVLLRDQTISEDLGYLGSVCDALIDEKLGMRWLCEARPGSLAPETLEHMHAAGCVRVHYGVETGDTEVFVGDAKHGIDPGVIRASLADTRAAGIEPSLHFLVGFEHDSWRSVASTVDLIRSCRVGSGDCSIMTPYPGTRFYRRMREQGRILADSWDGFTGTRPILQLDGLSPVELVTARWRILSALEENRRRGVRRRLIDARQAIAGTAPPSDPAGDIDETAATATARAAAPHSMAGGA